MKKNNFLIILCCIIMTCTQLVSQVGGIPIRTTILNDGGDNNGQQYMADGNCTINMLDAVFAANLEQFDINDDTPLEYGEIFYLPSDYPEMAFEYSLGSMSGIEYIDHFIYLKQDTFNGNILHLYVYSFEFEFDVSNLCQGSNELGFVYADLNYSLLEANSSIYSKSQEDSPYPICDYTNEGDIFPCSVFGFNSCNIPLIGGPEICNNELITNETRGIVINCSENCNEDEIEFQNSVSKLNTRTSESNVFGTAYPNPFQSTFSLRLKNKTIKNNLTFDLINLKGEVSANIQYNKQNDTDLYSFNFEHLPSGLYFLKVKNETSTDIIRIIKE